MFDFAALTSPILFEGNDRCAYRDPAVYFDGKTFFLYFTYVDFTDQDPYLYLAMSRSEDLKNWSDVRLLTPRDKSKNFSSPGNVFEFNGRYHLCLQTYCRENGEKYGNENSRLFLMTSDDLESWSEPEPMLVKGDTPLSALGRMIDPYVIKDKDIPGRHWCFFKQNGASFSCSDDLMHWKFGGQVDCGENVCVIEKDDQYLIFHSPENGIGVLESSDLKSFRPYCDDFYLGQEEWGWAKGRLTAAFVLDLTQDARFQCYLLFFHGSGPENESVYFDHHASIGIAWSHDLKHWFWPGDREN